jgi:hypothetical protein
LRRKTNMPFERNKPGELRAWRERKLGPGKKKEKRGIRIKSYRTGSIGNKNKKEKKAHLCVPRSTF